MSMRYLSLDELCEELSMEVVILDSRWKYYWPPRIVLEQSNGLSFFLRPGSNTWEFLPKN